MLVGRLRGEVGVAGLCEGIFGLHQTFFAHLAHLSWGSVWCCLEGAYAWVFLCLLSGVVCQRGDLVWLGKKGVVGFWMAWLFFVACRSSVEPTLIQCCRRS